MSSTKGNATVKIRRDTSVNWTSNNPTPLSGEWCLETDTGYTKIGDGSTAWTSLFYQINMFGSVDVKQFGATGDGTTDDTTAIQAALSSGYEEIIISQGTYIISTGLTTGSTAKSIKGTGTLKAGASFNGNLIVVSDFNTKLSGFKILGNAQTALIGIFSNKYGTHIDKMEILDCLGHGIFIRDTPNVVGYKITENYIHSCGVGISLFNEAEYGTISGNTITYNDTGISLNSGNLNICNNNILNNDTGVYLYSGTNDSHAIITDNHINHNADYGIHVASITESMCIISNNHLFNDPCTQQSLKIGLISAGRPMNVSGNIISDDVLIATNNASAIVYYRNNRSISGSFTITSPSIVKYEDYYYGGTTATEGAIFTAISPWVPNVGDGVSCDGQFTSSGLPYAIQSLYRYSTTQLYVGYFRASDAVTALFTLTSGGGAGFGYFEITSEFQAIT